MRGFLTIKLANYFLGFNSTQKPKTRSKPQIALIPQMSAGKEPGVDCSKVHLEQKNRPRTSYSLLLKSAESVESALSISDVRFKEIVGAHRNVGSSISANPAMGNDILFRTPRSRKPANVIVPAYLRSSSSATPFW